MGVAVIEKKDHFYYDIQMCRNQLQKVVDLIHSIELDLEALTKLGNSGCNVEPTGDPHN